MADEQQRQSKRQSGRLRSLRERTVFKEEFIIHKCKSCHKEFGSRKLWRKHYKEEHIG